MKLRGRGATKKVRSPEDRMTLTEHLAELRNRLIKSILAVLVGAIIVFLFYDPVLSFLGRPYFDVCAQHPEWGCSDKFVIIGPLDGFTTRLRVTGYGGLVLALPVLLWQLWRFITPGLHPKEKKYAVPFILSSVALFLFGASLAYLTLPYALEFLIGYSGPVVSAFTPDRYVKLVTLMMVAFGAGFLFPVVLVFLEIVGVVTPKQLSRWRRQAFVVIFVVAAVITPSGDPYSLFAMAIPMYIFYECSILIGWLLTRKKARSALAPESESIP